MRKEWEFAFTAEELLDLVVNRVVNERAKVSEWREKRDAIKKQIDEAGLRWHEAVTNPSANTTQMASQPMVDNTLLAAHRDAEGRLDHHLKQEVEFRRWVALLQKENPSHIFTLNYDDATYFGVYDDTETRS